eukprot:12939178-Prorocentrum_lima.AAC.1
MVDPRHGVDPMSVAHCFWNDHACNKNTWFSPKLMRLFQSSDEMLEDCTDQLGAVQQGEKHEC